MRPRSSELSDEQNSELAEFLDQTYLINIQRNSSEILSSIVSQTDRTVFAIQSILNLSSSFVISISIIITPKRSSLILI